MSRSGRSILAIAALIVFVSASALTACGSDSDSTQSEGSVEVTNIIVPLPPNPGQAAVYFTIDNKSGTDDSLVKAVTPAAGKADFHRSMTAGGMVSMEAQAKVDIPDGEIVTFEPGGLHVMLTDLAEPLVVGGTVDLTLTFDIAGEQSVVAKVVDGVDAASGDMGDMNHLKGDAMDHGEDGKVLADES